jgi:predicted RNA-binding protein with PIN domain
VLERALTLAREGLAARPPVLPPTALAPVLRFRRLPRAALDTVAQVLDHDEEFRAWVAERATEAEVGRAGLLWLRRDEGWAEGFARYLDDDPADRDRGAAEGHDALDPRQLQRRLEGAQRAAERATARIADHEREAAQLQVQTREARDARRASERERDRLRREVDRLTVARDELAEALARAEQTLVRRGEERRRLRERIEELEASGDTAQLRREALEGSRLARAIAAALRDGAGDADALAARLEARLEWRPRTDAAARGSRRSPLGLPGGLVDSSPEAARWLLSRPAAIALVDGYNVTIGRWGHEPIAHQRDRLVALLGTLAARHPGLEVHAVFDGADVVAPVASVAAPRGVQVRFTDPDTEADDELLALVDRLPPERPVIVVSDDRRVREGSRRRGANVVGADQLLAVAG